MEQQKVWMELTEKEVKGLGYNRYFRKHWKRMAAEVVIVLAVLLIIVALTDHWSNVYKSVALVPFVGVYFLAVWDIGRVPDKAGKQLWEEVKPRS